MPCSKCKDTATAPPGRRCRCRLWLATASWECWFVARAALYGFTWFYYMFYSWKIVLATHSNSWYITHSSLSRRNRGSHPRQILFVHVHSVFILFGRVGVESWVQGIRSRRQGQRIAVMRTAGWSNQRSKPPRAMPKHFSVILDTLFSPSYYIFHNKHRLPCGFLSCPPWHSSLFQGKGKGAALRFGSKSWVGPCWTRGCEVLTQSPHSLDLTQWLSRLMCFWRYLEDMEIRTWAMDGHGTDPGWLMIIGGHTTLYAEIIKLEELWWTELGLSICS